MCEQSGVKRTLQDIPFKIAALADLLPRGSSERSLAASVAQAVRSDIDYCVKRLEAGHND